MKKSLKNTQSNKSLFQKQLLLVENKAKLFLKQRTILNCRASDLSLTPMPVLTLYTAPPRPQPCPWIPSHPHLLRPGHLFCFSVCHPMAFSPLDLWLCPPLSKTLRSSPPTHNSFLKDANINSISTTQSNKLSLLSFPFWIIQSGSQHCKFVFSF